MNSLENGRVMLESHFPQKCKPHGLRELLRGVNDAEIAALEDLNQFRRRMKRKKPEKRPDGWNIDLENLKAHWHDLHLIRKYLDLAVSRTLISLSA